MTPDQIKQWPLIYEVFYKPYVAVGKPQRKDYPSAWEHARVLLKWKNSNAR